MLSQNCRKNKSMKIFEIFWMIAIIVLVYFVYREIFYISDLLNAYVRMLLESGSF